MGTDRRLIAMKRQALGLSGKVIPDPPGQGKPWTPPATKLPRTLVDATARLFELGAADPRGCEYREVAVGDPRAVEKIRGFVLPERPGVARRFAVGWDALAQPVLAVGAKANLDSDVQALAVVLKKSRESPQFVEYQALNAGTGKTEEHRDPISPFFEIRWPAPAVPRSPLTLCVLLRLGRADLAESLYAAATTWTAENARPDVADEMIGFPSLSRGWAETLYLRLIAAHCGADDAVALDAARRLDRFRQALAKAGPLPPANAAFNRGILEPAYVRNANVLSELFADQERRAKEAPRGPLPPRGGDQAARIAALIREFDQIHVQQTFHFAGAEPNDGAIFDAIVAEGDAAVGPLLAALESDTRLTRCVSSRWGHDQVRPACRAAYAALRRILKSESFMDTLASDFIALETADGRKRLAQSARAFSEKNASVPLVERWYRTLRDDSAGPDRWIEAASGLVQPTGPSAPPMAYLSIRKPAQGQLGAPRGEPLRKLRNPSVSELLARRCIELAGSGDAETIPDIKLQKACHLAFRFIWWDEVGSLPTLKALMTACRERSLDPDHARQPGGAYSSCIGQFTIVRARAGDREALDEFAAWLQEFNPEWIGMSWRQALEPLWNYPDHPALAEAARAMFVDPNSPWPPLVHVEPGRRDHPYQRELGSPLVCVPAYREALLAALADKRKAGTAKRQPQGGLHYALPAGGSGSTSDVRLPDPAETPGIEVPFRACDFVAWQISRLDGAPECALTWPEARRDAAISACVAYLMRFGPRLAAEYVQDQFKTRNSLTRLRLPALAHPATPADVRGGRAVFSLTAEGETRIVPLPSGFPARARWLALKSFPVDSYYHRTHGEFLQDGWVWQAEEVMKGDHWERYFGFVGHATIARVPAAEIEFSSDVGLGGSKATKAP